MNRRNYQRELEAVIKENESKSRVPRLLLHSCCAPCSSYVLEYLSDYFEITVFYYNPNISPAEDYEKHLVVGAYEPERFYAVSRGLEQVPEGGERCFRCFRLRLEEAAKMAAEGGFDYFATTLTISPLKNAQKLNEIGEELSEIYKVEHLPSDFKKKNGYKRSVELSAQYGLYRQNYCGCVFSKRDAEERLCNSQKEDR